MTRLIAGILRLDGATPDPAVLTAMLSAMTPDTKPVLSLTASSGPCAFGAVSIAPNDDFTPPPIQLAENGSALTVADLRLYGDATDPLLSLTNALATSGAEAGAALHGDFAFAHWDGTRLILGRDHFGVRPLQFAFRKGEYLAFASLPSALLRTGLARRILDAEVLRTYPVTLCAMGERTFYHDIKSVCPAHTATVSPGTAQVPVQKRYWRLPLGPLLSAKSDPEDLAAQLRALLKQAVQRRLPPQGPVAGHLSGGLDSTAIGTLAARDLATDARPFHAYCFREERDDPDLEIIDEWTYASAVAQREPNVRLHGVGTARLETLMDALDPELFFSTHPEEPEEQVLRSASEAGAGILLSGWGGDEIVSWRGHGKIAELFWTGQWQAMANWIRNRSKEGGSSPTAIFRKAVLSESLPPSLRDLVRSRHGAHKRAWVETIARMIPAEHRDAARAVPGRAADADSRVERRNYVEHWSIPEKLEAFAQRGARHGVSYAFPMLDLDLVAFAIRIPAILLRDEDHDRAIFRRAMEGVLPDMVRMKTDKLVPFPAETLRHAEGKADLVQAVKRMAKNPQVTRFVDTDGLIDYIESIRDPDQIRAWMNDAAARGDQISPYELYHIMALNLAWFLDRHAMQAE